MCWRLGKQALLERLSDNQQKVAVLQDKASPQRPPTPIHPRHGINAHARTAVPTHTHTSRAHYAHAHSDGTGTRADARKHTLTCDG